ncbi:MAG: pyridoxamine 5'-phosphate oxidase [Phycisphaerae bacterium]|jgi:pyridoxamine 5'-phosphate oxidase|nr:pyridoxamine 5'-phosphate oxidase [Phycisphaerae bacterium]MBT5409353.1 pyridoxamine 5'-phosphate oxidase [Phycisphaerae bacterium]MBT6164817.1 pyridoxamine 5'-phosphate oxidase [Phycisphaerae bacterium]MBT7657320.1 pyridoxamine 5'-phosphate oxidase [Phycisphaerae bacterium]
MNFNSPPTTPIDSMQEWFDEANMLRPTPNPLAMAVSTVDTKGAPSSRMVLLKGFDACGAVFYTNYNSDKASDIQENDQVSLLFHWDDMQRQIRIQGCATKVSQEDSDEYFSTRAKLSQAGAWASEQSQPLKNRTLLMAKVAALTTKWVGRQIPRPEHWGGYRVSLDTVELWQGHDGRLHDRIRYACTDGKWSWDRLQP